MKSKILKDGALKVVYEDEDFYVFDKPAGWIVNESKTTGKTLVLQSYLKDHYKYDLVNDGDRRSGIVHRLDKPTSGLIIVAKNKTYFEYLQLLFKLRTIQKEYTTLVHGRLDGEGSIDVPVGRLPWHREKFGVVLGGKNSLTKYKVIRNYIKGKNEHYSLVLAYPKTGRTHQIRIHMKYIGHPIVSDPLYSGRKNYAKTRLWCERLFLHASRIEFAKKDGEVLRIESKIPKDLNDALSQLEVVG